MSAMILRLLVSLGLLCSALSSASSPATSRNGTDVKTAKHGRVEQKYLPYLIALLNRNVDVLKQYEAKEQELVLHWKWLAPQMNHIVSGLADNILPDNKSPSRGTRSLQKPLSDDDLDWFVGGLGDGSKLGDKFRQLKSSTGAKDKRAVSRDSEIVATTPSPMQVNGVTVEVMGIEDAGSKTGEVLKMKVEIPRSRRYAAERALPTRAHAQQLAAVNRNSGAEESSVNAVLGAEQFFAPRVIDPAAGTPEGINAELEEGRMLLDILVNVQLLKDMIGKSLPCDPAGLSIIVKNALEEGSLTTEDVLAICKDPQQAFKTHRRRETTGKTSVATDKPTKALDQDQNDSTTEEESEEDDVFGDLKGLASSFSDAWPWGKAKTTSTVEPATKPIEVGTSTESTASGSISVTTPKPSTTTTASFLSNKAVFGGLYGEDESDEEDDAEDDTADDGASLGEMFNKVKQMFTPSSNSEPTAEETPTSTTEAVVTAGTDANVFDEGPEDLIVEDTDASTFHEDHFPKVDFGTKKETFGVDQTTTVAFTPTTTSSVTTTTPRPTLPPKTRGPSQNYLLKIITPRPTVQPSTTRRANTVRVVNAKFFPGGNEAGPPPTATSGSIYEEQAVVEEPEVSIDLKRAWKVAESNEIDENKFHRHVVISIGLMSLMGVVAIAVLAMLRQTVVSRGSAEVDNDIEAPGTPDPSSTAERRVTMTTPLDDDEDDDTPKKEAFQMVEQKV